MKSKNASSEAQLRLIEAADRLFYQYGVRTVGIDKVIAEAGVAKMTLYGHYKTKDDLILAVLAHREEKISAFFDAAIQRHRDGGEIGLEAFFSALGDWFRSEDFRGCAFINATVELADANHPGSAYAREHKQRFSKMLEALVHESVGAERPNLAKAVAILVEGAIVTALIQKSASCIDVCRNAAMQLAKSNF